MVKALLLALGVLLQASAAWAQSGPSIGYIGMFKDATHATTPAANTVCPSMWGKFQAWIWIMPSVNGMHGAEFTVSFPAQVIRSSTIVKNPDIMAEVGTLEDGITVGLQSCHQDWTWLYQIDLYWTGTAPAKIEVLPYSGEGYRVANCLCYPIEPIKYLTPLYICWTPDPGPLAVEEKSWGAIKQMFEWTK